MSEASPRSSPIKLRTLLAATALATFAAAEAKAVVIDDASYTAAGCLGAATCTIGTGSQAVTLTALPSGQAPPALFAEQNFAGVSGLGIAFVTTGQARDPEVQGDGGSAEGIQLSFASLQTIVEIIFAHFYNPSQFSSDPQEIALITATNGGPLSASFQVVNNAGNYTFTGALTNATATLLNASQGLWRVTTAGSVLGSTPVSSLTLRADNTPVGGDNSDYSVNSLTTTVPEPATLGLLGIGLAGLGFAFRRSPPRAA